MNLRRRLPATTALAALLLNSIASSQQSNDCLSEINGALRGGSGNIQDHMFHSLAIDPANENVVYAGTETSGIFKTVDGGATWSRLRRGLKCGTQKTGYPQIFDIAIDPSNSQTLYAATVNGPGPADDPVFPSATGGVYKSTDGGLTWTQKVSGFTNNYTSYVLVDSTNPLRVFAGIGGVKSTFASSQGIFYDGGIWASDNGGDSWTPLGIPSGVSTNILIDMVLRGSDQRTIYASGATHGSDAPRAYGLIRSTDGGQTWAIVNPPGATIMGFDAFRQNPRILYGHDDSPQRRAHRSTDGGDTWTQLQAGFFGPVKIHPADSQTLFVTGRNTILKSTDGLATQRVVYTDAALPQFSQMVDIKIAPSNPRVIWAAAKGYYLYRSTDGGETFTKITAVRDLIYGSATRQTLPAALNDALVQTGVALVNSGSAEATATLTLLDNAGGAAAPAATVKVPAGGQYSRLLSQLFGQSGADGGSLALASDRSGLAGFFLLFDPALETLDGAPLSSRPVDDLFFPEIRDAEISLVNPGANAADVVIRLYRDDGAVEQTKAIGLPPGARYAERVTDLFGAAAAGYLRVTSTGPITGLQRFGGSAAGSTSVLGAQGADTGTRFLYSPQFVVGGGYTSTLTVVNLENAATTVSMSWNDNAGIRRGSASFEVPPFGRVAATDGARFGVAAGEAALDGYVVVGSSRTRIAGSVRFGGSAGSRFEASLPLPSEGVTDVLYPQVAQDATWFTGVAILNAGREPAAVTISIFDGDGKQVGRGERTLASNARISEILTQIDPALPALSRGYFRVTSNRAVLSFAVFGTQRLSALAAVPGQQVWP